MGYSTIFKNDNRFKNINFVTVKCMLKLNKISVQLFDLNDDILYDKVISGDYRKNEEIFNKLVIDLIEVLKKKKQDKIIICITGAINCQEQLIHKIENTDLEIISIKDITPIPHNGCRPPNQLRKVLKN